jgi:soluble lytic murein transglycosylase-like protein
VNRGDALAYYRTLIEQEAGRQGLPPGIAEAVTAVESGYNPGAIGGVARIGLTQILPSTARMLGFAGSNGELALPESDIRCGVTCLPQAWWPAGGDLCAATMKYRAGYVGATWHLGGADRVGGMLDYWRAICRTNC